MIKKLTITLLAFSLVSCFSIDKKQDKKNILGERNIQYYSNKTVTSLEVPPDLTKPSSENAFKISQYVEGVSEETIDFTKKETDKKPASAIGGVTGIKVKKLGAIRWLEVSKKPELVWALIKSFFKSHGFAIKKIDKKIGIIETDFLENYADIPDQSVGLIRSLLKQAIDARYALGVVDKYRARIEPVDAGKKTEVYLTLSSMEEVITKSTSEGENTIWQARAKDYSLETEMLYRLMVYLGSDDKIAIQKIEAAENKEPLNVQLVEGVGGYAKLQFQLGRYETWANISWALDQLNIDVEDKDVKEGSFYINIAEAKDKGILSFIFGENAIKKSFQIAVKQISGNKTEVHFNDLSETNDKKTIDFSYEFLSDIAKQLKQ